MNAAGSPRAAAGRGTFVKIDIGAGLPVRDSISVPAILGAERGEAHRLAQKRTGADEIALNQARAFQATDLVLLRNRTLIPRAEESLVTRFDECEVLTVRITKH